MTICGQDKDLENSTNVLVSNQTRNTNKRIHSRVCSAIGLSELFKIGLPEVQEAQLVLCSSAIALTT